MPLSQAHIQGEENEALLFKGRCVKESVDRFLKPLQPLLRLPLLVSSKLVTPASPQVTKRQELVPGESPGDTELALPAPVLSALTPASANDQPGPYQGLGTGDMDSHVAAPEGWKEHSLLLTSAHLNMN